MQAVGTKRGLGERVEAAVRALREQLARLPLGAAGIDVVAAVARDVADGQRWALGREQMRHQRLAAEVEERVLPMLEADRHAIGDVGKERRMGGWADGRFGAGICLDHCHCLIHGDLREHLNASIGPDDRERVDARGRTQTKVGAGINR